MTTLGNELPFFSEVYPTTNEQPDKTGFTVSFEKYICSKCTGKTGHNVFFFLIFLFTEEASGICDLSRGNAYNYMTLKGSSGTFFSPNYPVPYPARPDTMCIWTISVPEGKRVQLKFKDIDFGKISANKSYMYLDCMLYKFYMDAYIDVRDGEWIESTLLGSYCGNKKDVEVYSTGRNMKVVFHPIRNGVPGNRGFKAHFESVDLCKLTYHTYFN